MSGSSSQSSRQSSHQSWHRPSRHGDRSSCKYAALHYIHQSSNFLYHVPGSLILITDSFQQTSVATKIATVTPVPNILSPSVVWALPGVRIRVRSVPGGNALFRQSISGARNGPEESEVRGTMMMRKVEFGESDWLVQHISAWWVCLFSF